MNTEFSTAETSAENNMQARRSPVALASRQMALSLAIASILLSGCAHLPITQPEGPGGVVVGQDATGLIFDEDGYLLWIEEGVPAKYFTPVPGTTGRWHITRVLWHAGNQIRLNHANGVK